MQVLKRDSESSLGDYPSSSSTMRTVGLVASRYHATILGQLAFTQGEMEVAGFLESRDRPLTERKEKGYEEEMI